MEDNQNIKEELYSLYKILNNEISKDKMNLDRNKIIEDIKNNNVAYLIKYIKESILLLVNHNNNYLNVKNHYNQLENQIIKLEKDKKYYISNYFRYKIQNFVLEMKINEYVIITQEFEKLKKKVKYEQGKFLENDRKDNEIIILRRENSTLKKEIFKLDNINRKLEIKNNEYIIKIKDLGNAIKSLNKKISNLEKEIIEKNNSIKNNLKSKNLTNSYSQSNIGFINNENSLINNSSNKYRYNLKNLKYMFNLNNKNILNFYSPKFDINPIEQIKIRNNKNKTINAINKNIFNYTYSQIINEFKDLKKQKKKSIKNKFKNLKLPRNNSISIILKENDERKSILIDNNNNLEKSKKTKNLSKILNLKPPNIFPLSVENKTSKHISDIFIKK